MDQRWGKGRDWNRASQELTEEEVERRASSPFVVTIILEVLTRVDDGTGGGGRGGRESER